MHAWSRPIRRAAAMCLVACAIPAFANAAPDPRLKLRDRENKADGTTARSGSFRVYEDRAANAGRVLELDVVILPKLEQPGRPDPVFVFAAAPWPTVAGHAGLRATPWTR